MTNQPEITGNVPRIFQPAMRKAQADFPGFQRMLLQGILEQFPRLLFALLPVFAMIVALFYRRLKYPEHLYFAIHLHAFVFLALALIDISKFARTPGIASIVKTIVMFWIPTYSTLAFRRVYGGSIMRTLVKEMGIGMLYSLATSVALLLMVLLVLSLRFR
jgi:hypothetical protein